jgi:hypothetical protein
MSALSSAECSDSRLSSCRSGPARPLRIRGTRRLSRSSSSSSSPSDVGGVGDGARFCGLRDSPGVFSAAGRDSSRSSGDDVSLSLFRENAEHTFQRRALGLHVSQHALQVGLLKVRLLLRRSRWSVLRLMRVCRNLGVGCGAATLGRRQA